MQFIIFQLESCSLHVALLNADKGQETVLNCPWGVGRLLWVLFFTCKWLNFSFSFCFPLPTKEMTILLPNMVRAFFFLLQNSRLAQSLRNLVCQSPSFTPINGSPEPPKACTSRPQVNGISNWLVLFFLQVAQCEVWNLSCWVELFSSYAD